MRINQTAKAASNARSAASKWRRLVLISALPNQGRQMVRLHRKRLIEARIGFRNSLEYNRQHHATIVVGVRAIRLDRNSSVMCLDGRLMTLQTPPHTQCQGWLSAVGKFGLSATAASWHLRASSKCLSLA